MKYLKFIVRMPEWSNGNASRAFTLVVSQVRILFLAFGGVMDFEQARRNIMFGRTDICTEEEWNKTKKFVEFYKEKMIDVSYTDYAKRLKRQNARFA